MRSRIDVLAPALTALGTLAAACAAAAVALALLSFAAPGAFADVKLFREGRAPGVIRERMALGGSSFKPDGQLNRGTAAREILGFVDLHRATFGLARVDGEILQLRATHQDAKGASLRFIQRFNRVPIEGAELVAILDGQGELAALNSSLVPTPRITVQPSISREEALKAAVRALGYRDPELGDGHGDGLRIDRAGRLVWQFSIREHSDGSNAAQVQVGAQGAGARILKTLSLAHGARHGKVSIYDASVSLVTPNPLFKGVKVLEDGKPTLAGRVLVREEARAADDNLRRVRDFYAGAFGRTSWDGQGADIDASMNAQRITLVDLLRQKQNAAWMGPWKMFVFGAGGDELGAFTAALDVVGHEYTHAVIGSSSNLAYEGQSGALNEHLADVFGAMIEEYERHPAEPFLIGDTILRGRAREKARALRDMLNPEKGLAPQPGSMKDVPAEFGDACRPGMGNDNCGVHILSGIPNRVVALTVQELGWEATRDLYYRVMTARLRSSSRFTDYRDQTLDECGPAAGPLVRRGQASLPDRRPLTLLTFLNSIP
jgi:Zn-dependent metalloprotease